VKQQKASPAFSSPVSARHIWGNESMRIGKPMRLVAAYGWLIATGMICSGGAFAAEGVAAAPSTIPPTSGERQMPRRIEQFAADRMSLSRIYPVAIASSRMVRFQKFYDDELAMLASINFDKLSEDDQIDYLLLKNRLTADLHQLAIQREQVEEMQALLPFAKTIEDLLDRKRLMERPDGEKDAAALTEMVKQMTALQKQLDPKARDSKQTGGPAADGAEKAKVNPVVANRAAIATMQLSAALKD
jgi:hypothetical protein